jgi:uncharacterized protein YbaP (TraB family)
MRLFARLFLPLVLLLAPAAASARPPVWIVRDADSTILLFGSVHILPPALDWRPPELKAALAQADDVWFETPFDEAGMLAAQNAAAAKGLFPDGESLSALLKPRDLKRLQKVTSTYNLSLDYLDRLKPWYAAVVLEVAIDQKAGGDRAEGVERQLYDAAPARAKRKAFETPEQQIGFFADAPLKDQLASFNETVKEAADAEKEYRELVDAWMSADLKKLDEEAVQPLRKASPTLYATLVSDRNARWTEQLLQRLHGSGNTVVVVGVGHLVGKDSVPNRLRALGVEVDGPR